MSTPNGSVLLECVARRIVARYLSAVGSDVKSAAWLAAPVEGAGIDLTYVKGGVSWSVKVKADPYFGRDRVKVADRELPFYRQEGADYAFEAVSNHLTRQPGWVFQSDATRLFYYFLAIATTEPEVADLVERDDDGLFSGLAVERDELHMIALEPLQAWFEEHYEEYTPRPVFLGDHSAWYRIVPRAVLQAAVPVDVAGPIFALASRG